MKRIVILILAAGLNMLCGMRVVAGDAQAISLKEAEDIAVRNHPRITAAQLESLASEQAVRQAQAAYYPTVTANVTAVGTSGDNTRVAAGSLNNPLILERNAEGINVSQILTDFGRTASLAASSKLHSRAQKQNTLATRAQIILQVDAAYFDALAAQSVLTVASQTVATRQLISDQISGLASNNLKSGLDVSFAMVSLEEGRLLEASASNGVESAYARLSNLLGERESREYQLAEEAMPTNMQSSDAAELVQEALKNRPDLARLRFEQDAAGKFAQAEHELHYPTISAVGTAGVIPIRDPLLKDNYAAAGVNLSLPIFEGMLFSARAKEAELKAKEASENLRDSENNVIRDVRLAALDVRYSSERLQLTGKLLASANEAFDLAQARYKVGSSSIVELSQAQLSQTEAAIAQARAKYEYQVRLSILRYQTGQVR